MAVRDVPHTGVPARPRGSVASPARCTMGWRDTWERRRGQPGGRSREPTWGLATWLHQA